MSTVWQQALAEMTDCYKELGCATSPNGSELIGHVPHVGPEGYLFVLHAPLSTSGLAALESALGRAVHPALKQFFSIHNGVHVFADELAIYGRRTSWDRTSDDRQPYDIVTANTEDRPVDARAEDLFFAGYGYDRSLLFFRGESDRVFVSKPGSAQVYGSWNSFDEMLVGELPRLRTFYDELGRERDPAAVTTPQFA